MKTFHQFLREKTISETSGGVKQSPDMLLAKGAVNPAKPAKLTPPSLFVLKNHKPTRLGDRKSGVLGV